MFSAPYTMSPWEARVSTHLEVEAAAGKVSFTVTIFFAFRGVEHVRKVAVEVRQEAALVVGIVTVGWI